ncbi:hypothetical protein LINPERPRIM_LOCUS1870 [Linum perenne]
MATDSYCTSDLDLLGRPSPIGKLGDDLLVEILIRSFPNPKSSSRCKAVCKQWSSLISSPCFNRRFVSHHQTMNPVPYNPNELQSIILSFLPPLPGNRSVKVLDCFKDLVLCCEYLEPSRSFLICNPFTEHWIALPLAPNKSGLCSEQVTRLVCEPCISSNLDLGDDQSFVYSEYRFRVVYVFCSESGEWKTDALVLDRHHRTGARCAASCNDELFWMYQDLSPGNDQWVAVFNPFRLDIPPAYIDTSQFSAEYVWRTWSSQGAMHVISYQLKTEGLRVIVWRLEEDRKSWRKQCQGLVRNTRCCSHEPYNASFVPFLHPHNPEVVLFECTGCHSSLLSCDLTREETELFAYHDMVFEPRVSCWPTPIPRYNELRRVSDESLLQLLGSGQS